MDDNDRILRIFVNKLDELKLQKKAIENQIEAISIAYESMGGSVTNGVSRKKKRIKADRKWEGKTIAYFQDNKDKSLSLNQLSRNFNITKAAASQRCILLVKAKKIVRVARGHFKLV